MLNRFTNGPVPLVRLDHLIIFVDFCQTLFLSLFSVFFLLLFNALLYYHHCQIASNVFGLISIRRLTFLQKRLILTNTYITLKNTLNDVNNHIGAGEENRTLTVSLEG